MNLRDVLNIITVSIPEKTFLLVLTLILLDRFDLLRLKNLVKLPVPIIPAAVLPDILRNYGISASPEYIISIIIMFMIIIIIYRILKPEEILRAFSYLVISAAAMYMIQFLCLKMISYALNKPFSCFNSSITINFLATLPGRVFEFFLIFFVAAYKLCVPGIGAVKRIVRSDLLRVTGISFLLFYFIVLFFLYRLVVIDKILADLPIEAQLVAVTVIVALPIAGLSALWTIIYNIYKNQLYESLIFKTRLIVFVDVIKNYINSKEYSKINHTLSEMECEIEQSMESIIGDSSQQKNNCFKKHFTKR